MKVLGVMALASALGFSVSKKEKEIHVGLMFETEPGGGIPAGAIPRVVPKGYTILDVLATTKGIEVDVSCSEKGLRVVRRINEKENNEEMAWQCVRDDDDHPEYDYSEQVRNDDHIRWRYVPVRREHEPSL